MNLIGKLGIANSKIFPVGGDPVILPRKINFCGSLHRDVFFAEKVILCNSCKTRHMFGENCPVATPTPEDSDISFSEQSGTPTKSGIHHFGESPQKFSAPTEDANGKIPSGEVCDSNSDSELGLESCSDSESPSESGSELKLN